MARARVSERLTRHRVRRHAVPRRSRAGARTFAANATTRTIIGPSNGKHYTFRIAARNARGVGLVSFPTAAIAIGAPKAPKGATAKLGHKFATVHWTAPANNGGVITRYSVTPYKVGGAQFARTFSAGTTTRRITGLLTGRPTRSR